MVVEQDNQFILNQVCDFYEYCYMWWKKQAKQHKSMWIGYRSQVSLNNNIMYYLICQLHYETYHLFLQFLSTTFNLLQFSVSCNHLCIHGSADLTGKVKYDKDKRPRIRQRN